MRRRTLGAIAGCVVALSLVAAQPAAAATQVGNTCSGNTAAPGSTIISLVNGPGNPFPATIPSVYVRMYAQAQHIDLDYYDAFYGPEAYLETHRQHLARWHG